MKLILRRPRKDVNTNATTESSGTINDTQRFNLVDHVAQKAQIFLMGSGFTIPHSKEFLVKEVSEILEKNNFEMILNQTEYNISSREEGNQLIYIQPDIEGNTRIGMVNMEETGNQVITDQYGTILNAMTYVTGTYGMLVFRVIQKWGKNKMTSVVQFQGEDGGYLPFNENDPEQVAKYNSIPLSFKFLKEWEYEQIPLVNFTNFESIGFESRGDALHARGLQEVLDKSYISEEYEMEENITRSASNVTDAEAKSRFNIGFGGRRKVMKISGTGQDNGNFEVLQGDPKLSSYNDNQLAILNKFMDAANYSQENDFNGVQTQVGILFKGKADIETTNLKKGLREKKLIEFLDILIKVHNQFNTSIVVPTDEPLTITLNSFLALDQEQRRAELKEMVGYGIATFDELIDNYYKLKGDKAQIDSILKQLGKKVGEIVEQTQVEEEEEEDTGGNNE